MSVRDDVLRFLSDAGCPKTVIAIEGDTGYTGEVIREVLGDLESRNRVALVRVGKFDAWQLGKSAERKIECGYGQHVSELLSVLAAHPNGISKRDLLGRFGASRESRYVSAQAKLRAMLRKGELTEIAGVILPSISPAELTNQRTM